jgi:PAS domain S-box-containing protein
VIRLGLLSLMLTAPAWGQVRPGAPVSVIQARIDADGNSVPDRMGDTLTVAGRVSAASGELTGNSYFVTIQDASGGLALSSSDPLTPVARGDSVHATGVVTQYRGLTGLMLLGIEVVPAERRPVEPVPYSPETSGELLEGRLVAVEGRIVGEVTREPVELTALNVDGALVNLLDLKNGDLFAGLRPGDAVRVVGVLGQYDQTAPYTNGYQILPRGPADVKPRTLGRRMATVGLLVLGLLAVASLVWVRTLRWEVRRRLAAQVASEGRYKALFERVGEAVVIARMDGMRPVEFHLNPAAARLTGYGLSEHGSLRFDALYRPVSALRNMVAQALAEGEAQAELDLIHRDGSAVPVEIHAYRFDALEGDHLIFLARDVSRRKQYEQGLVVAREEAEELARMQASFVANMSHELRTPLAGIIGFADILASEAESEEHREFAQLIGSGGERLLGTLNSILDLARLDAGGYLPVLRPIDLVEAVRAPIELVGALARQKGLELHLDAPERPIEAMLDAAAVDRIVTNLVGNAIKFTDRGAITVRLVRYGDRAKLTVSDTGRGISQAFLDRVFEPFTQESHAMNRTHEGAGLGLSITRHLVRGLNGTIAVSSDEGCGTVFTVTLPLLPPAETIHPTEGLPPA